MPALEVGRDETPLRVVEELAVGRSGHVAQATVGPVAPAVVRAGEAGRVPLRLLAEAVAAVPADVEEGVDLARAIAHDDDALARDLVHDEVAGSGQLGLVGDERPLPEEHPLDLGLERGRRRGSTRAAGWWRRLASRAAPVTAWVPPARSHQRFRRPSVGQESATLERPAGDAPSGRRDEHGRVPFVPPDRHGSPKDLLPRRPSTRSVAGRRRGVRAAGPQPSRPLDPARPAVRPAPHQEYGAPTTSGSDSA